MEFIVKEWKQLLLSWHKRILVIEGESITIKKSNNTKSTKYSLQNAVLIDKTKKSDSTFYIDFSGKKIYIKANNLEDKEKIITKLNSIIKINTSKTAFSSQYQRYNRELAKFSNKNTSPYEVLIQKAKIFQNLLFELNKKMENFKCLIENKNHKSTADYMNAHNNMRTIQEEMEKQFGDIMTCIYSYHDHKSEEKNEKEGSGKKKSGNVSPKILNADLISSSDDEDIDVKIDKINEGKMEIKKKKSFVLGFSNKDFYNENYDFQPRNALKNPIKCPQNLVKDMISVLTKKQKVPIYFNEPITMLQKQCEKFIYMDLLTKASQEKAEEMQLCYIGAFIVAEIFTNIGRTLKPFSPIIGETFEYFDNKKSFRYIAEQVKHNPQVTAFIAGTPDFSYYGDTDNTNSFKILKGAFEISFKNKVTVLLKKSKNCYTYNRPLAALKGLMKPPLHNDYYGTVTIHHTELSDLKCVINFQDEGFTGKDKGNFEGKVYSGVDEVAYIIKGNWQSEVYITDKDGNNKRVLIAFDQNLPYLKNTYDNYVLPDFTYNLNYLPENLEKNLPKNDSRFRKDVRLLEEGGDLNKAQEFKSKYEQKQRDELDNDKHKILYFNEQVVESKDNEDGGKELLKTYIFNGKYWEDKSNGKLGENENREIFNIDKYEGK